MSVLVAHQASAAARLVLHEAATEARLRRTVMSVLHVAEAVDIDMMEKQRESLRDEVARFLQAVDLADLDWTLTVEAGVDVAETVLDLVAKSDVDLLVIGARRRSAVGKMLMGSVTQTILLRAEVPVLVVKAPQRE